MCGRGCQSASVVQPQHIQHIIFAASPPLPQRRGPECATGKQRTIKADVGRRMIRSPAPANITSCSATMSRREWRRRRSRLSPRLRAPVDSVPTRITDIRQFHTAPFGQQPFTPASAGPGGHRTLRLFGANSIIFNVSKSAFRVQAATLARQQRQQIHAEAHVACAHDSWSALAGAASLANFIRTHSCGCDHMDNAPPLPRLCAKAQRGGGTVKINHRICTRNSRPLHYRSQSCRSRTARLPARGPYPIQIMARDRSTAPARWAPRMAYKPHATSI